MTISTTVSRVSYNGNGVTTAFATTFRFFEAGDLVVQLVEADETVVMQTITTDYTVTGADDDAGGTVTMIVPPASGERLVIQRVIDAVQETDYESGDSFPAESHERALDRLTMLVQQNEDGVNRSLRLDPTSLGTAELPSPEAGKFLGWSGDGLSIVNLDSTGTGAGEIDTANLADDAVTTVKIADDNVTFAKVQNIATARGLGRITASSGNIEELTSAQITANLVDAATDALPGKVELATATEFNTGTDPARVPSVQVIRENQLILLPLVNTTSGTSVSISTAIPAWVRRIVANVVGVSTNGTDAIVFRIGPSGGAENSGYNGRVANLINASAAQATGIAIAGGSAAGSAWHGQFEILLADSATNTWTYRGSASDASLGVISLTSGSKSLAGVLTQMLITTPGGANTFDGGYVALSLG